MIMIVCARSSQLTDEGKLPIYSVPLSRKYARAFMPLYTSSRVVEVSRHKSCQITDLMPVIITLIYPRYKANNPVSFAIPRA